MVLSFHELNLAYKAYRDGRSKFLLVKLTEENGKKTEIKRIGFATRERERVRDIERERERDLFAFKNYTNQ